MSGFLHNNRDTNRINTILDKLPLILYHFLPGHKVIYANENFCKFFGVDPSQIIDKVFLPPLHPDDNQIFTNVFSSLSTELPLENLNYRLVLHNDETRWIEWSIVPIKNSSGKFIWFQAIIKDLTEYKRTEYALKQSEHQYRLLFDLAADMIVIIDKMGNFLDMNRKFEEESGWRKNEMLGKNVFTSRIVTNESAQKITSYLNRLVSGNSVPAFEIQGITRQGKIIDYEIHAVPIQRDGFNMVFQAILRNISEKKIIEKALKDSQRQLSNILSNLPGMAYRCLYEKSWTMKFVSSGSYELTGYPPDALIDNNIIAFGDIIKIEDREQVFADITAAITNNKTFRLNYRIITADGKIKWVWEQGNGVRNSDGEIEAVEGFITDITEQRMIQEALRENEELYRKLISTLPDMIVITDLEGKVIFVNEHGISLSGYKSFSELKHRSVFEFISDKDKPRALNNFSNMVLNNPGPVEYTFVNKSGKEIEFEVNGEVLRYQDQSPYGFIFCCREITSRKLAEAALAQSEEQYRTLVDSMQDGVFLIQDGKLNFVNQAFADLVGYTIEELLNADFTNIVAPEDYELVLSNYRKRQAGEEVPSSYEWRMLHKNGSRVYVNMSVRLINFKGNIASIGTLKNVTQNKKLDEILRRQRNLLSATAEASNILLTEPDFIKAINQTLSILGKKAAVDRVYIFENGYSEKARGFFMSQKYEWVNENISPQIDNPELQMLSYDPIFSDWLPLFNRGEYFWSLVKDLPQQQREIMEAEDILSILEVPIKIKDELWGFVGFDDCTTERTWDESEISILKAAAGSIGGAIERDRFNKELISAKENAEEMNRLKSNFLANMSHELRTPLIAILGYSELLAADAKNQDTKNMLETIHSGGTRLLDTLNHILDLSKIESGKVIVNSEPVNIKVLIDEVISLFKTLANKKGISLKAEYSSGNFVCLLDKRFLRSILNNLIGNAVKFTDKGSVVVESSLHKSDDQSTLILTVKDTGIGISETNKKLIFDAFRQGSEGYNREYEGTGLGLTITKKYVEILNGEINLVSEHGKGSTFTVSLPVIQIESDLPDTTQPNESVIEEDSFKNRVLFVDDDAASRSVLSLFLRKLCEIDVAANGDEAIQLLRDNNYSLILLDISLGKGITGIDLLKMIRADGRTTHLPVMAITAHAMVGDRERFLNEGFNEYISKPFSKDQLLNKIKALLEQKK